MASKRPTAETFVVKTIKRTHRTKSARTRPGGYRRRKQSGR